MKIILSTHCLNMYQANIELSLNYTNIVGFKPVQIICEKFGQELFPDDITGVPEKVTTNSVFSGNGLVSTPHCPHALFYSNRHH